MIACASRGVGVQARIDVHCMCALRSQAKRIKRLGITEALLPHQGTFMSSALRPSCNPVSHHPPALCTTAPCFAGTCA